MVKWLALVAALGSVLPLALWLRGNTVGQALAFSAIGLLPFFFKETKGLDMALVSWDGRQGYTQGIELTVIDILALAIYLSLPKNKRPLPFRIVFGLYFLTILLSIFQAEQPLAAVFYAWQFARVFFLFAVVALGCQNERVPAAVLQGMALGILLQVFVVVWQRYGLHELQTPGTFVHQNTLGMVVNLAIFPQFALLLIGSRRWTAWSVPLAGVIIAALTASRGTVALCGMGLALTYALLSLKRFTVKKAAIGAAGLIVLAALAPLAWSSFEQRFAVFSLADDYGERAAFERAANLMLSEHPMGVGANHYVVVAKERGYSERAGVYVSEGSRNAHVHNAYLLAAAETGYIGLVALALLMLWPMAVAIHRGWRDTRAYQSSLLLGIGSALLIMYLHCFVEWIFFTVQVQYFFGIYLGLIAGTMQQPGYSSPSRRRFASEEKRATRGKNIGVAAPPGVPTFVRHR